MRRILGTVIATAALVLVAGCGGGTSSVATDPASDPAGNPTYPPGPIKGVHVLPLISMTGASGHQSSRAAPLNTPAQVAQFLSQFRAAAMKHRIRTAVSSAPTTAGRNTLVGQVVSVGCDRPPGVDVLADPSGHVQIMPHEVASPLEECLVPVTTVALAVVPPA